MSGFWPQNNFNQNPWGNSGFPSQFNQNQSPFPSSNKPTSPSSGGKRDLSALLAEEKSGKTPQRAAEVKGRLIKHADFQQTFRKLNEVHSAVHNWAHTSRFTKCWSQKLVDDLGEDLNNETSLCQQEKKGKTYVEETEKIIKLLQETVKMVKDQGLA